MTKARHGAIAHSIEHPDTVPACATPCVPPSFPRGGPPAPGLSRTLPPGIRRRILRRHGEPPHGVTLRNGEAPQLTGGAGGGVTGPVTSVTGAAVGQKGRRGCAAAKTISSEMRCPIRSAQMWHRGRTAYAGCLRRTAETLWRSERQWLWASANAGLGSVLGVRSELRGCSLSHNLRGLRGVVVRGPRSGRDWAEGHEQAAALNSSGKLSTHVC